MAIGAAPPGRLSTLDLARRVAAALPLSGIAFCYFVVRDTGEAVLGMDAAWLRDLVWIEFLAMHSFPFVAVFAVPRPRAEEWRVLQWAGAGLLVWFYAWNVERDAGWDGVLAFAGLAGLTYLGFLLRWSEAGALVAVVVRGLVLLFGWLVLIAALDVDPAGRHGPVLTLGAWYFALAAAMELSGFYQLPLWAEIGSAFAAGAAAPERRGGAAWRWLHRGVLPLLGAIVITAAPYLLAWGAATGLGRTLEAVLEWRYGVRGATALAFVAVLAAARLAQLEWLRRERWGDASRLRPPARMLRRAGFAAALLVYAGCGLPYVVEGVSPHLVAASPGRSFPAFAFVEALAFLDLAPLTWRALVRRARRRDASEPQPDAGRRGWAARVRAARGPRGDERAAGRRRR